MPWPSPGWLPRQGCRQLPGPRPAVQSRCCLGERSWAALPAPRLEHPLTSVGALAHLQLKLSAGGPHGALLTDLLIDIYRCRESPRSEPCVPAGLSGWNGMPWPGKGRLGGSLGSGEPARRAGSSPWGD